MLRRAQHERVVTLFRIQDTSILPASFTVITELLDKLLESDEHAILAIWIGKLALASVKVAAADSLTPNA